jgi:hypothetical protein
MCGATVRFAPVVPWAKAGPACTYATSNWIRENSQSHILHSLPLGPMTYGIRHSVVSIVTRLEAGRSGVESWAGTRRFTLLQKVKTGSEAHPAAYSMSTVVLWQGSQATHLQPVPRLRIGGILCSSYIPSWVGQRQLQLFTYDLGS